MNTYLSEVIVVVSVYLLTWMERESNNVLRQATCNRKKTQQAIAATPASESNRILVVADVEAPTQKPFSSRPQAKYSSYMPSQNTTCLNQLRLKFSPILLLSVNTTVSFPTYAAHGQILNQARRAVVEV